MVVIWLCNTLLPEIANKMGIDKAKPESWISAVFDDIRRDSHIKLVYLFPSASRRERFEVDGTIFISYHEKDFNQFEHNQVDEFKLVIKEFSPNVIHAFGTECPHSYAMMLACREMGVIEKLTYSIQGLVSIYARHYYAHLQPQRMGLKSFRDIVTLDGMRHQQKRFENRGKYEIMAIKSAKHIIGRTEWDWACAKQINPRINYHHCNETLRSVFYEKKWSAESCNKHSIFMSQWYSPIKGMHILIEAMGILKKHYPDIKLYTTGKSFLPKTMYDYLKLDTYRKMCVKMIKERKLENSIVFQGYLDENAMCNTFLKANVFVCCSSIENSPNSVGEAMLLGMPVVSADVGGVRNLMKDKVEGLLYPSDEPYMLAYYISMIFEKREMANELGENARLHALKTHDRDNNYRQLIDIYNIIGNES